VVEPRPSLLQVITLCKAAYVACLRPGYYFLVENLHDLQVVPPTRLSATHWPARTAASRVCRNFLPSQVLFMNLANHLQLSGTRHNIMGGSPGFSLRLPTINLIASGCWGGYQGGGSPVGRIVYARGEPLGKLSGCSFACTGPWGSRLDLLWLAGEASGRRPFSFHRCVLLL
jgi:hypothetical protein